MKGVDFIIDEHKNKKAVIIEMKVLDKFQDQIEDLLDGLVAENRRNEQTVSFDSVKSKLKALNKI